MESFICSHCGRRVNGNKYEVNKKSCCYDCYQKVLREKEDLEKQKQDLYNYICSLFSISEMPLETISAIDYLIKSGKKIKAIQLTLQYYYLIEGHNADRISNIKFVVENYYDITKKYIDDIKIIKAKNKEIEINVPAVNIKLTTRKTKNNPHKSQTKIEEL